MDHGFSPSILRESIQLSDAETTSALPGTRYARIIGYGGVYEYDTYQVLVGVRSVRGERAAGWGWPRTRCSQLATQVARPKGCVFSLSKKKTRVHNQPFLVRHGNADSFHIEYVEYIYCFKALCSTALRCAASHDNTAVSLLVLVAVVLVLRNERCEGCGVPGISFQG